MTTLHDCPECALPATVTPSGWWHSTHGPVDHVFVRCAIGHWFLGPAEMLSRNAGEQPPPVPPR